MQRVLIARNSSVSGMISNRRKHENFIRRIITCLSLGPVFSVPGVRKLALQSAVPMANVVTRPRGSLTEENLLPDLSGI